LFPTFKTVTAPLYTKGYSSAVREIGRLAWYPYLGRICLWARLELYMHTWFWTAEVMGDAEYSINHTGWTMVA